jgi:hypothetical protein
MKVGVAVAEMAAIGAMGAFAATAPTVAVAEPPACSPQDCGTHIDVADVGMATDRLTPRDPATGLPTGKRQ